MKKWVCGICGYIYENKNTPKECPVCSTKGESFKEKINPHSYDDDYEIGIAKDIDEELTKNLRANFNDECREVGMYLAMSRIAYKEGYDEIGETYERIAFEEAYHAANFAELLGEAVNKYTEENLKSRIEAEYIATQNKLKLAKKAKELGAEVVHKTINNMCKDEIKHSKAFMALLEKYFENKN